LPNPRKLIAQGADHLLEAATWNLLVDLMSQQTWLLVYVRYVYGGSIKGDFLFCKPLETRTTGEDTLKVLDSFVTSHGLWWSRCVGICADDGAKAMTGRHSGVVMHKQAVAPDATWGHCSIHRETLAANRMPDSLKAVLKTTVKIDNFVKVRPLNSRVFSALYII
jgi:hypothetical protein